MSNIYLNVEFALEEICLSKMSKSYTETQKSDYYSKPWKYIREFIEDIEPYLHVAAETCLEYEVRGINIPYSLLSEQNIKTFKKYGIPISTWTVNEEKEMIRLFLNGIENLTTQNVAKAKSIRMNLFSF